MDTTELWAFLVPGYLFTVLIESAVLAIGLSPVHTWRTRLAASFWLTGVTYPIVVLVLPVLFVDSSRWTYLAVAEIFAPAAESILFYAAYGRQACRGGADVLRDTGTIVAANVASFVLGMFVTGEW